MSREVALQQMKVAKQRCGNSKGQMQLTHPDRTGTYYASFENDHHASAFQQFLTEHNVSFQDVEPGSLNIRPKKKGAEQALIDALDEASRGRTGMFSNQDPLGKFFR